MKLVLVILTFERSGEEESLSLNNKVLSLRSELSVIQKCKIFS
jgi:hypothetical protein